MRKKTILIIAMMALLALATAGGIMAWRLAHPSPLSPQTAILPTAHPPPITPPPSLAELATRYPELADLLSSPGLNSAYKGFLVAYQQGGLEAAQELARQRGLLSSQNELRMVLVLDVQEPEPVVAQLEAAGIRVEHYYRDLVSIAIPLTLIAGMAEADDPGAALRQISELEHVIELRLPESSHPEIGAVDGEGVAIIGADTWHAAGYGGRGVKIAILDGSFKGYQSLLGTELPDTVIYKSFAHEEPPSQQEAVHGTACAEIVHEIAPEAELYLVAYSEDIGFGRAVDWLIDQGVDVVSHSASWLADPRDGSGRRAQIVDQAAAAGIMWVNSAGNYAEQHYSSAFTDSDGNGWHEFGPSEEVLAFHPGSVVNGVDLVLNWDSWPHSSQDINLFLLDDAGNVLAASTDIQDGSTQPTEILTYEFPGAGTYYVAIQAVSVTLAVNIDLLVSDGRLDRAVVAASLGSPADARGAVAVGATHWADDELERFSSQGPTLDGRSKPDISAPNGVLSASYSRFGGTSAAAPHVAGAAALVLGAYPGASLDEVKRYLQDRALDLGPTGMDNGYGAGRLDLGPVPMEGTGEPVSPTDTVVPTQIPAVLPIELPATPLLVSPTTLSPSPGPSPMPTLQPSAASGRMPGELLLAFGLVVAAVGLWLAVRRLNWPRLTSSPQAQARYCRRCGQSQRPNARFCNRCGSPLATPVARCPACRNAIVSKTARFCGHCGRRLMKLE